MFLLNSRLGHFTAAPSRGAPLLPKLRGYFAEFLDQVSLLRLGIFYPPTCVGLRYGLHLIGKAFLGTLSSMRFGRSLASEFNNLVLSSCVLLTLARAGILTCFPSPTPYRPRLRSRLTLGRKTLPRKPRVYGGAGFHRSYRYSCLHSHFSSAPGSVAIPFTALENAPLPRHSKVVTPRASVLCLSPIIFGAGSLDE